MQRAQGKTVALRLPGPEDAEARFALGKNPEIARMYGTSRDELVPLTREAASRWVETLTAHPHAWVIEVHGNLAGEMRLDKVDLHDRRATMAIGLFDPALLGKGFGTEAITLLLRHAFHVMKLHRIGIRVLAYNHRAIRAYEKCGFIVEGRERESGLVDGAWHDDIMMGLLSHEFLSRNPLALDGDSGEDSP